MNDASARDRVLAIMLVAGEPSGDRLGAQLMAALKTLLGQRVRIVGVGGSAMAEQGLASLFSLDATAVMGLREVLPRIPQILKHVREASDFALKVRPDLVVMIDSPDFTHRIARRIKRIDRTIRTVNYSPPQVWASRAYRARAMARYFDAALTLLPFEAPFFEKNGLKAIFVGYPVLERARLVTGGDEFRRRFGIAPDQPLLAVLPGSRRNEIRFILPPFKKTVERLARDIRGLVCVMPTVAHVAALVRREALDWPTPVHVVESEADKFAAFDAADAALAASGTVTSELALARTPMVVGYRMGRITYALAHRFLLVPYIVLINLILDRQAVPEFVQKKCEPEALAKAVKPLLSDTPERASQVRDLDEAVREFGAGGETPSLRAARALLTLADASVRG